MDDVDDTNADAEVLDQSCSKDTTGSSVTFCTHVACTHRQVEEASATEGTLRIGARVGARVCEKQGVVRHSRQKVGAVQAHACAGSSMLMAALHVRVSDDDEAADAEEADGEEAEVDEAEVR